MYKVIKGFTDKYDKNIKYKVNDEVDFSEKRAKEILTVDKLIEKIEEKEQVQEEISPETAEIEEKPTKKRKKSK